MKKLNLLFFSLCCYAGFSQSIWINEIHYDNVGGDIGEAIEIAGPAGTDLTGYTVIFYNGSGGAKYDTVNLSGIINNEENGFGTLSFLPSGSIQNGSPDGIALVDSSNTVLQFLSYEGSFAATDGAANGMFSTDIGVSESGASAIGESIQLQGAGNTYTDFTWTIGIGQSFGNKNIGQSFSILSIKNRRANNFKVYPNPTSAEFVIIKSSNNQNVSVNVFDILGKQIVNNKIENNGKLDVSGLNAGIYIIRFTQGNTVITKKLIIE